MTATQWGHVARCAEARARLLRVEALALRDRTGDYRAGLPQLIRLHDEYGSGDAARMIAWGLAQREA